MYYVYILQSLKVQRFYIGVTTCIDQRVKKHNQGGSKSTKPYRPWKLIYFEKHTDKKVAYKREYYLKRAKGYQEKLDILKKHEIIGEVR